MVEPIRKKNKARGAILSAVKVVAAHPLIFTSSHPRQPGTLNLCEFATGMSEAAQSANKAIWSGPFSGRPKLIAELAPHIKLIHAASPELTLGSVRIALRRWWRLLDKYHDLAPVETVKDLDEIHGALQIRDGVSADTTNTFLRIVNAARACLSLPPIYWTKNERINTVTDLPPQEDIKRIYHELCHRVQRIWRRWEQADLLSECGTDWTNRYEERPQNLKWTECDIHASYRGLAREIGHPCPSQATCLKELNVSSTGLTKSIFTAVFGLYPSREDVQDIFMLFLLRTGWNAATVINIDATTIDACVRPHPLSNAHHIVTAIKERGYVEQAAIGLEKSVLSPGNLIKALFARTELLREQLRKELSECEKSEEYSATNEERIVELKRRIRSPWLYVSSRNHNEIDALGIRTYSIGADRSSILRTLIHSVNEAWPNKPPISDKLTLSDFRDVYISFAYQASGYSWLVAQLAAGHSSVESLKTYFRKRRWKAHGQRKISQFLEALWAEIHHRRVVDPAVLHAMVQRGEITEDQRRRWENYKDRTRVGTGCKDFRRPPKEVAPHHVKGAGCRVQRCTLCPHAIVFQDSVNHLARRLAELYDMKSKLPLLTWTDSNFPDELEATKITLSLFDESLAAERLGYWKVEIEQGRHVPLSMEGEYGA